jgi:sugar/nucleoside kinase (ribokinase family)
VEKLEPKAAGKLAAAAAAIKVSKLGAQSSPERQEIIP